MIATKKTMTTEFITVYPPPPPTCNRLIAAQRANFRRSTKKVGKVLGATLLTTLDGNVNLPTPVKVVKRKPSLLRLFSPSSAPSPQSSRPAVLHFSDRPSTPSTARPVSPPPPPAEGANKRAKLARLQRLLGNDVPVDMVFPAGTPPPTRPGTPSLSMHTSKRRPRDSLVTECGPHPAPRKLWNIIRIPVPSLTEEEKRSLGLQKQALDSVQEEEELKEDIASIPDEASYLSLERALGAIVEEDELVPCSVYSSRSLDRQKEDLHWSAFVDDPPSPTELPHSPVIHAGLFSTPFSSSEKENTSASTWFDVTSPTMSRFSSPISSHYSFHAERRPSSEYERSLRTPSPQFAFLPSIVCDDDEMEPALALSDALFDAPIGKRWSELSSTA